MTNRRNVTLMIYGPTERMDALLVEEKLRMANGERSPLEAFARIDGDASVNANNRGQWTTFRVDASSHEWVRSDPWVESVYQLMDRLLYRENVAIGLEGEVLGGNWSPCALLRFEFVAIMPTSIDDMFDGAMGRPLRDFVEIRRTRCHEYVLGAEIQSTPTVL